ncbi:MAG: hypothetical protein ACFB02_00945 [Mastigocoleus sp.]
MSEGKNENENDNDQYKKFIPHTEIDHEKIVVEVSPNLDYPYKSRVPNGYDPMGEIQLRGKAFRGLAGGRIPWWVLISGWIIFGGFALLILSSAISTGTFTVILGLIPALLIVSIPILILWRGTSAKLSLKKHRAKRRY